MTHTSVQYHGVELDLDYEEKRLLNILTDTSALRFGTHGDKFITSIYPLYMEATAGSHFLLQRLLFSLLTIIRPLLHPFLYQLLIFFWFQQITNLISPLHLKKRCICSCLKRQTDFHEAVGSTSDSCLSSDPSGSSSMYVGGKRFIHFHFQVFGKNTFLKVLRALTSLCMYVFLVSFYVSTHTLNQ